MTALASRAIALATCAILAWTWFSFWTASVVAVASRIDASGSAILAGAAVAATVLIGIGVFLAHLLYDGTCRIAAVMLGGIGAHWRPIVETIGTVVLAAVVAFGGLAAIAAILYGYAFAFTASAGLVTSSADVVGGLTPELTADSAGAMLIAFARTYLAGTIIAASAWTPYVIARRLMVDPRIRRGWQSMTR